MSEQRYQRPKLTDAAAQRVTGHIRRAIAGKSHAQLIVMIVALALENAALFAECNEHRRALGITPMRDYIPGGGVEAL